MDKIIKITPELRDYIERLQYEATRYEDLLKTVNRNSCPMTDAEWESSLAFYKEKCAEANFSLKTAMDTLAEIYADAINGDIWHINYRNCELRVGSLKSEPYDYSSESYMDYLSRLYPENIKPGEKMDINNHRTKDITLQVTDSCNLNCSYCYQHNKGTHHMSFETAKQFLDMILDSDERTNTYITSTECDGVTLDFIGGEPWLEVDLITKVSDYFIGELFRRKHPWAIKFMFGICSNGLLHFDPRVQAYIDKHHAHLSYSISIDGNKELHDSCRVDHNGNGSYDRAIAGVKDYESKYNRQIGSKMTIAPNNVDKVFDAVSYMIKENHYMSINLNCVYEEGWTNEHANILYEQLHKLTDWLFDEGLQDKVFLSILDNVSSEPMPETENNNWCGGSGLMLAVDYKGDIYPCLRYMESSVGSKVEPYIIGTIADGINCKPEHCDRIHCFECVTRKSQSTDECFNCPIAYGCGWCSAYNYETFGTPNKRATYICCMHKARSLAVVYNRRRRGMDFQLNCPKDWAVEIVGEEEYERLKNMKVGDKGWQLQKKTMPCSLRHASQI